MAHTSITWQSSNLQFAGATDVYIRQAWADPWVLNNTLFATEQTWSLLPSMPVAQLERDYGVVLEQGATLPGVRQKLSLGGYYVKIVTACADGSLTWIGYIDEAVDEQGGADGSGVAYGTQRWVAYALPQALSFTYLTRSRWWDEVGTPTPRWSGSAIGFNQGGRPNRTATMPAADSGKSQTHMFAPSAPINITDDTPYTLPKYWSSRDILLYLQEHAMPLDQAGAEKVPFRIDGLSRVPDWDRPTIETEGKSVLSILDELVNQGRMLQFAVGIDETTTPHTVILQVYSLASATINLPGSNTHPAAEDTVSLALANAQDTRVVVQSSESRSAHQIVVKGAKRQVQCTLPIAATGSPLLPGWNSTQESAYEAGASGETGYGDLSLSEKQLANQAARAASRLADVYRTFVLNPAHNLTLDGAPVFVEADGTTRYYPWWNAITIAPQLLMKEGIDYATIPVSDDDANREFRPPAALFRVPLSDPAKYLIAERMSNRDGDPTFSVEVGISKDGQGLTLDVSGAEQHAIAGSAFTALDDDFTGYGSYDYTETLCTVALTDDRFAEYEFPQAGALPTRDVLRRKIYYAGEAYRYNVVHRDTAWNVNAAGALVETTTSRQFIHDDIDELQSIGQIAASWWLVPRKILRLTSPRPSALVFVGQLLTTLNAGTNQADTINSIVSEIRLTMSRSESIAPAVFSITTASGEVDPLAFSPPDVTFGPVPLL